MSTIDEIRQEIERRKKICEGIFERESDTYYQGKAVAYGELLPFIDTLEEPDKSLEEAAEEYQSDARRHVLDNTPIGTAKDAFIARAKWQKEQKPAEWSEEDEEMLEYVIGDVNDAKQLFATKDAIDLCDKEIAWLKSLRPDSYNNCNSRWKPSEEQMSMLLAVINDPNNAGAESCQIALKSLYEQLKKLM